MMVDDNAQESLSGEKGHEQELASQDNDTKIQTSVEKSTAPKEAQNNTGIKAVLDQVLHTYEKLPILETVFDKFIRQLSISIRNLTSEPVDIKIESITSLRLENLVQSIKKPAAIALFNIAQQDSTGLAILETNLVFSFVDVLLGGKNNVYRSITRDPNKLLTAIEETLAEQVVRFFLKEFALAFESTYPLKFEFHSIEYSLDPVIAARPTEIAIVLKVHVVIDDRNEYIQIVLPYKVIESIKIPSQLVIQDDTDWYEMIVETLYDIDFPLDAVIMDKPSTLSKIMNLKIGDTLVLDHKVDDDVLVRFSGIPLYKGQIGKSSDKVAVHLKQVIKDESRLE